MWFYVLTKDRRDFDQIKTLDELRVVLDGHFRDHPSENIVLLSSDPWECPSTIYYDACMDSTADDLAGSIDFIGIFSSSAAAFAAAEKEPT